MPRVFLLVALLLVAPSAGGAQPPYDEPRTILAAFAERSYAPGARAVLNVRSPVSRVSLRIFHAGPEGTRRAGGDIMTGVPVTPARRVDLPPDRVVRVPVSIDAWPSGLYFARLQAPGGYLGFAPFVLRPRVLGTSRVAVVLPTHTWQAYNFRDVDGDGVGDTWYADSRISCVDLGRPYLNRGAVQRRIRGFLRWFEHGGRVADFLSDDDLDRVASGDLLAKRYDFVLFASHEEYVTSHVWDVVTRYRDLGGNLAFLSANSFFIRVDRRGKHICKIARWKDLGRSDAAVTGVHYVGWWENRYPSRPYVVRGARRAPWLFKGTGLRDGDTFGGRYGVEVDMKTTDSPPGTIVLASIDDIFGPGRSATMTYYETGHGARVFASGVMGFEYPQTPDHKTLLDNLWAKLVKP